MKSKLVLVVLIIILIVTGIYVLKDTDKKVEAEEIQPTLEMTTVMGTDSGVYSFVNIPEGEYEVGTLFYIECIVEYSDYGLKEGDVVALYELNDTDVDTLMSGYLSKEVEVSIPLLPEDIYEVSVLSDKVEVKQATVSEKSSLYDKYNSLK